MSAGEQLDRAYFGEELGEGKPSSPNCSQKESIAVLQLFFVLALLLEVALLKQSILAREFAYTEFGFETTSEVSLAVSMLLLDLRGLALEERSNLAR